MAFPIPASGLCVVAPRLWSLRLFYQLPGGPIGQAVHLDGAWSLAAPTFSGVPLTPLASTSWDDGKQIRVYFLDAEYHVQEYCFTEGKGWYAGEIGKLKAKAKPVSRLAALVYHDKGPHLRVYYQEHESNSIVELCNDGFWHTGELHIRDAVEGSGIAAVTYAGDGFIQIRVYYQTFEELYLKEYCHNNKGWFPGQFAPGKAPLGTPIAAVAADNAQIHVFWRADDGHALQARHTGHWNPPTEIKLVTPGFGLAVLKWEAGKRLRLYHEDYKNFLYEVCSDNGGDTWFAGEQISGKVW